jgi:mycofactocin precursor
MENEQDLNLSSDDEDVVVEEELLIEEISIDGMCGVY